MQGINYVTDESGEKVAVLISLKKHKELWEDFYDLMIAELRAQEPRTAWKDVKSALRKSNKLKS